MNPRAKKTTAKVTNLSGNTITSLPPSPVEERHGRMVRYSISMGIRMACIIVVFFVPDWWRLVPAIGAVVLPYIAVVLANAGHDGPAGEVERPGGVELYRPAEAMPGQGTYDVPQPQPQARPAGPAAPRGPFVQEPTEARPKTAGGYRFEPYAPGTAPRAARPSSADASQPQPRDADRPRRRDAADDQPPARS